jgi:hypothetical protein
VGVEDDLGDKLVRRRLADSPRIGGVGMPVRAAPRDVVGVGLAELGQRWAVVDPHVGPQYAQIPSAGLDFDRRHAGLT